PSGNASRQDLKEKECVQAKDKEKECVQAKDKEKECVQAKDKEKECLAAKRKSPRGKKAINFLPLQQSQREMHAV
ncbi:MAG: hypothetical protein ACI8S6_004947, partial [Myxococcota bacterium]